MTTSASDIIFLTEEQLHSAVFHAHLTPYLKIQYKWFTLPETLPPHLENDIIVGGDLKSNGVYAGGQEREGWRVVKRAPAGWWWGKILRDQKWDHPNQRCCQSFLTGTIVTPTGFYLLMMNAPQLQRTCLSSLLSPFCFAVKSIKLTRLWEYGWLSARECLLLSVTE